MSETSRFYARIFNCVFQSCCLMLAFWAMSHGLATAQEEKKKQPPTPGPMLAQGTQDFDTPDFTLTLVRSSQTVAALKPKGGSDFDFTPGDLLIARSQNGYFHLGDITLRLRSGNALQSGGTSVGSPSGSWEPGWGSTPRKSKPGSPRCAPQTPPRAGWFRWRRIGLHRSLWPRPKRRPP